MKSISVWGWLEGHDGQRVMGKYGQDAGVTPLLFFEGHPGILGFLMTTESQDLGLTSHPKDVKFVQFQLRFKSLLYIWTGWSVSKGRRKKQLLLFSVKNP